jgi:hypothetical protein
MAEILGLGISHWPRLGQTNRDMSIWLRRTLQDPDIPADKKDPATWPARMREEWADDEGLANAQEHRDAMVSGLRRVRETLDAFKPDAVIVWGDDQYENFREDLIPAFCVLAYEEDQVCKPWGAMPNAWGEDKDTTFVVKSAPKISRHLADGMLEENFDIAYAYKPLHFQGLPHAFINAVLYLDYDRKGFPHPIIPFQVNCYGRYVISHKGIGFPFAEVNKPLDPPSPSPARCFDLGRAVARVMAKSPYRVALMASSSWSHAFLCDKHWHLWPDVVSDRKFYDAMVRGDWEYWRSTPLAAIEASGQHELLNWFCLFGAMTELGYVVKWSEFVETYVYNSDKVAAVFGAPVAGERETNGARLAATR